jgi:hypothetical protein
LADAVTSQTLYEGTKRIIYSFTNNSDGTGESTVKKVDISTLASDDGSTPTAITINRIRWACSGMSVLVAFDHTTDDTVALLAGTGEMDLREYKIPDPASTGGTGDILFTTVGHTSGDTYWVVIEVGLP